MDGGESGKMMISYGSMYGREYMRRTEEKQNMVVKAPYRVWETVEAA